MIIKPFEEEYIDEMTRLFMKVFSEPGRKWGYKQSRYWIEEDFKKFPQYCFMAFDEKNSRCMGAIFGSIRPYWQGEYLYIADLMIKKEYRRQGVATTLMRKIMDTARENNLSGAILQADNRIDFPKKWYQKMGFRPNGWEEFGHN